MADDENSVAVSIGFSMTAIISPCPKCCIWQVCIRKRKYPASEGGVFITGSQIFGLEPATVAPEWITVPGIAHLNPDEPERN